MLPVFEDQMNSKRVVGGSLPVANVQALASKDLKDVPARYIWPELESDVVNTDESDNVPVIDLSRLLDPQFMHEELTKLHSACEVWGFFQLINHGVPEEVVEKMKVDVEEFFKLPLEEKKQCSQLPDYIEGYGQAFVTSEEQKLEWGDMFLSGCMAKNLGVDPEKLTSIFENNCSVMVRMGYYPPCAVDADKVLGISPHSDASAMTILLQVNEVHELQIKKNGNWIPIKPIPGAFIVNIGDVIEIMSNGKYKSIEHRVVIDPLKERMSIAAFQNPVLESLGPLPEVVKVAGGSDKYKTLNYNEYKKFLSTLKPDGKIQLEFMKLD